MRRRLAQVWRCSTPYNPQMLKSLRRITFWLSDRWWKVVLVILLNFGSLNLLLWLERRFTALTGKPVFDTQNDLTEVMLRQQVPLYIGEAKAAYIAFAAFDFVFALTGALVFVVMWAVLLKAADRFGAPLLKIGLPLVALGIMLADWVETAALLAVVAQGAGAGAEGPFMQIALMFKRLKLAGLTAAGPVTMVFVMLALIGWVSARKRKILQ